VPSGWTVTGELQGWQFRVDVIAAAGLRFAASAPGDDLTVWVVTDASRDATVEAL